MDEGKFREQLDDLIKKMDNLPESQKQRLVDLALESKQNHAKLKKNVSALQESLDYLRLSTKYLLFDLEATRRENAYLRKMLEESGR
jgi:uncharacterized protein YfbU (UPF0304 family)